MNFRKTGLVGLLVIGTFGFTACKKAALGSYEASYSGVAISPTAPEQRIALGEIHFTYLEGDATKAVWSFIDERGNSVTDACQNVNTSAVTCSFVNGGLVHYTLTLTDTAGREREVHGVLDVLLPASVNNGPEIRLAVYSGSALINKVGTLIAGNVGTAVYSRQTMIRFDLSGSIPADNLYTLDAGDGIVSGGPIFTHTFPNVGVYLIKLTATDPAGAVRQLSFTATVQCQRAPDGSPLEGTLPVINPGKIVINEEWLKDPTQNTTPATYYRNNNYFNFDASNAVSGGGPGNTAYKYFWDYNGDGFIDDDWSLNSSKRAYTTYSGTRKVSLKVMDVACNYFTSVTFNHNFPITHTDAVPGNSQEPQLNAYAHYYHLQAKMSAVNPTSPYPFDALQNADFIASWNTKDDPYSKRVQCNYGVSGGQGAVTIQGLNLYGGSAAAEHGMKLSISGILDSVPNGSTGFLNTSGAWIEQANYWTDQGSDQALGRGSYSKNGNCSLNMKVKKVMAASPCASDQTGGASSAITIDGAYSCANLHSLQGDVKVDNGAFYCETSTSDACIGGGTTNPGVPIAPR